MNCDCTEKISLLIDGELSRDEAREIERHLLTCAECQHAHADFLSLRSELSAFRTRGPDVALRSDLARILGDQSVQPVTKRRRSIGWAFGPAAAAFATLIIASVIVSLFFFKAKDQNQPGTQVVATASPQPSPDVKETPSPTPVEESSPKDEQKRQTKEPRQSVPARRSVPVPTPKPGEQFALIPEQVRPADPQTMTMYHFEKSEFLLRSFRNVRISKGSVAELSYEKKRAKQLVVQNMILRREADAAGDVQSSSLLESLEPILVDIANLPDKPTETDVQVIKDRVERKNIVPLLQVNSTALARALD